MFASLVFAFAMPVIKTSHSDKNLQGRPLVVVYLDNSFSMESLGAEGKLFEQAVKKASEVAAFYSPSDEFYLITNDFSARFSRVVNRSDFQEMLTLVQLTPSYRSATEVMDRIRDLSRRYPGRQVIAYLLSDFQQSTLKVTEVDADVDFPVFLIPLRSKSLANLYIDTVWMEIPVIRPGQIAELQVRIGNTGTVEAEEVPVTLSLNERETAVGTIDVPAEGKAVVNLAARIVDEGIYYGIISIDDYPVIFDDRFYIGTRVRQQRAVSGLYSDNADPSVKRIFEGDSLFYFENRPVTQLDFAAINKYDIIFCQGISEFSSGLLDALKSYVSDGGTLVVIPPDQNKNITGVNSLMNILGLPAYGAIDTSDVRIASVDFDYSLFKGVFSEKPSNIAMPTAFSHYMINAKGAMDEKVIIKLLNDRPMLISSRAGKGLVYQFATSFSSGMTNFASHAELFVPVIFNMALYSGMVAPLFYTIGSDKSATIPWPDDIGQSVFHIRKTDGEVEFIPGYRNEPFGALLFFEDQVSRSGNYQVMLGDKDIAPLAFNFSHYESDLRFDDVNAIEKWIKSNGYKNVQILSSTGRSITEKLSEMNDGNRLWRYFVVAALIFLLAESLVLRLWKKGDVLTADG